MKNRQVKHVYILEFKCGDDWLVSCDAMAFNFKKAAQFRANQFMKNSGMKYRVSRFKRA